jgi:hypothetical protein
MDQRETGTALQMKGVNAGSALEQVDQSTETLRSPNIVGHERIDSTNTWRYAKVQAKGRKWWNIAEAIEHKRKSVNLWIKQMIMGLLLGFAVILSLRGGRAYMYEMP